jgi:prevent-host-death family protein
MAQIAVAELQVHLGEYLARVQAGEEIVIADQGEQIARLVPSRPPDSEQERLLDLQRRGLLRLGTGDIPESFWTSPRIADPDASFHAALRDERAEDG